MTLAWRERASSAAMEKDKMKRSTKLCIMIPVALVLLCFAIIVYLTKDFPAQGIEGKFCLDFAERQCTQDNLKSQCIREIYERCMNDPMMAGIKYQDIIQ